MSRLRKSNLHAEEVFAQKIESLNLDPRLKKLLLTYEEVFRALPPPLSCKKLVQMDLKLKPEFEKTRVRRRPYPAPQEQVEEIERQIQECIDAGLVKEYKKGDYPLHCSPCFLVAKPGSTALRLVVDYGEVNKKTQNHSGSTPNMENTLERIAKCWGTWEPESLDALLSIRSGYQGLGRAMYCLAKWTQRTWGIPADRWVWVVTLRPQQMEAPPNRGGPTPPRPTTPQLCPYMVAARLMALLWPGPHTPTQNYPHLTEEDMPGIQRCFFETLDYLQQTHPRVLEQIWPPPG